MAAFALAAALEISASPAAFAGAPTERLREFFAKVEAVLHDPTTADRPLERVARVRRLVADIGDVEAAAVAALGPAWETKTVAERDEFVTLFADLIERAYVARLAGAVRGAGGLTLTYGEEIVTGSEATVNTMVRGRGGHDLRVDFRMIFRGGRWRVRDLVVDGISTVEGYRAQFKRLLRQGAQISLVTHMREKLMEESLMFARSEHPPAEGSASISLTPPAAAERPQRATPPSARAARPRPEAIPSPAPIAAAPLALAAAAPPVAEARPGVFALRVLLLVLFVAGLASVLGRRSRTSH